MEFRVSVSHCGDLCKFVGCTQPPRVLQGSSPLELLETWGQAFRIMVLKQPSSGGRDLACCMRESWRFETLRSDRRTIGCEEMESLVLVSKFEFNFSCFRHLLAWNRLYILKRTVSRSMNGLRVLVLANEAKSKSQYRAARQQSILWSKKNCRATGFAIDQVSWLLQVSMQQNEGRYGRP